MDRPAVPQASHLSFVPQVLADRKRDLHGGGLVFPIPAGHDRVDEGVHGHQGQGLGIDKPDEAGYRPRWLWRFRAADIERQLLEDVIPGKERPPGWSRGERAVIVLPVGAPPGNANLVPLSIY